MKKKLTLLFAAVILSAAAVAAQEMNADPAKAQIVTSDIELFWKAYDKATPANDLIVYRDEYLKKGSPGLQAFTALRIGSVCRLVDTISARPKYYAALRASSLKVAGYEPRMRESFRKLKEIYPDAEFPNVYFVVGAMNSGGTLTGKGLLIGVEMYGKTDATDVSELSNWHKAVLNPIEKIPLIVAHELIHYQQRYEMGNDTTLLGKAIQEGSADFIGELISGGTINEHLFKFGDPIEKQLWLEFKKEMNGTDVSNWLYQGDKAVGRPADLGYYIGYKITRSYYENATDKKQAIRDILNIKDFGKFLEASKYE
ncbi:MAG TPA: DUF2268 domain-containing putative Zn-dependent protease [Pyrinomonadaceae bacterium]|nr:DUF2268 domain-containing putative Zn-dependent protease [Pyrinomonadaceae bacterium]